MPLSGEEMLRDVRESLKHVAGLYQSAAQSCDSDRLRKTLNGIASDKTEQCNAVFNLLHQMGDEPNAPADADTVEQALGRFREAFSRMQPAGDEDAAAARAPERELRS